MIRKSLGVFVVCASLALAISLAAAGVDTASQSKLSAAAIVDKNVAARGGLQAWRTVQTFTRGETGRRGESAGYSSSTSPGPTCQRADACYAAGRGGSTAVCDGAEAPPQNAV